MLKKSRFSLICSVIILYSLYSSFAIAEDKRPLLIFDQGHNQRFLIEEVGSLHLKNLAGVFSEEKLVVVSEKSPLSDALLADAKALVISGAFQPLLESEIEAVTRFVERGGNLAIMIHIPSPLKGLLEKLEVDFTNFVLHESSNLIESDSLNFKVTDLSDSQLFNGVSDFSMYGVWALVNTSKETVVTAKSSASSWLDVDGDKSLSKGDAVGSFGVVVKGVRGKGKYLVFGDDAMFQNRFLSGNNEKLARNLAQFLSN